MDVFPKSVNIYTNESVDFPIYLCTIYLYVHTDNAIYKHTNVHSQSS